MGRTDRVANGTHRDRLSSNHLGGILASHWRPLLALLLIVLLANGAILTGFVNCDPEKLAGGLTTGMSAGFFPGQACFCDPAPVFYIQPLGRLSALDWLHGIVPWWNPYSGIGMPLAAEMQNESLFLPFVLLLVFHNGWFIQRLAFQLLSGLFTYAFLIRIGTSRTAGLMAAALFALNGAFYLTAGTVAATFFTLPLLLLGVELAASAARQGRRMGWSLVTIAITASLYAGFPETAYLQGLFAASWASMRLIQSDPPCRWRLFAKLSFGCVTGVVLAAPQLLPFAQYLQLGTHGGHGSYLDNLSAPYYLAPIQMFPFAYGELGLAPPTSMSLFYGFWERVGGWFGCLPVFLALFALLGPCRQKGAVRALLIGWILLWQIRYFGPAWFITAFNYIPGVAITDAVRYAGSTVMLAVFALAAMGLDTLHDHLAGWRRYFIVAAGFLVCVGFSFLPVLHFSKTWFTVLPALRPFALLTTLLAIGGTLCLGAFMALGKARRLTVAWVVGGAMVTFLIPQLAAPRGGVTDKSGIAFLAANAGLSRVYGVGPYSSNFLASRQIASVNYIQLPAPQSWFNYVRAQLDADANSQVFLGSPGAAQAFLANLPHYEALGVRYVTTAPVANPFKVEMPPAFRATAQQNAALSSTVTLRNNDSFTGYFEDTRTWPAVEINSITFTAGTPPGGDKGSVAVLLCKAYGDCVYASASLAGIPARATITVDFPHPFAFIGGKRLAYVIAYHGKGSMNLWLGNDTIPTQHSAKVFAGSGKFTMMPGVAAPINMQVTPVQSEPPPPLVWHGKAMNIYQLPHPAPYADAPGCILHISSRQLMETRCAHPSFLVRREQFYPGWAARINGKPALVSSTGGIFQRVSLPQGNATIRFAYTPPGMHLACGAALLALLFWLSCGLSRNGKADHPANLSARPRQTITACFGLR